MAEFKLYWASGEKALVTNGEWHLVRRTPQAYDYANKNLNDGWTDHRQVGSKDPVFIFRDGNAELPDVLANLRAAGIAQEQIEVVCNCGHAKSEHKPGGCSHQTTLDEERAVIQHFERCSCKVVEPKPTR
ncbi:MAG: hypothetical protein LAO06_12410 [Acidobacteriia bacterium]|nr:hypothetical protein [Terriglobia bacterium]